MKNIGVISMGIKTPIIREGDNLAQIVVDSVLEASKDFYGYPYNDESFYWISDKDVIGITESVVARSLGNYVTVDEIALELQQRYGSARTYVLVNPIYSRNRFSMILKAIARTAIIPITIYGTYFERVIIYMPDAAEVGNPSGVNQFTGVNMMEYYKELVNGEDAECIIHPIVFEENDCNKDDIIIYCGLHDYEQWKEDYGE